MGISIHLKIPVANRNWGGSSQDRARQCRPRAIRLRRQPAMASRASSRLRSLLISSAATSSSSRRFSLSVWSTPPRAPRIPKHVVEVGQSGLRGLQRTHELLHFRVILGSLELSVEPRDLLVENPPFVLRPPDEDFKARIGIFHRAEPLERVAANPGTTPCHRKWLSYRRKDFSNPPCQSG